MAKPKKKYTEPVSLPMLPLRGLMVFPHMVLHFDAGRKKSIAALDQAMEENQRIFLVAQRDMDVDDPAVDDIYHVGTIACVKQVLRLPGGNVRLLVEGKKPRGSARGDAGRAVFLWVRWMKCSNRERLFPSKRTRCCARRTIILRNIAR